MNSALFARLVAQVEDAGPGAMRVLQPLGLKPSQYLKMVADWNAQMENNPSLRAEFAGALSTARQAVPRVPVVAADLAPGSVVERPALAVPSYMLASGQLASGDRRPPPPPSTAQVDVDAISRIVSLGAQAEGAGDIVATPAPECISGPIPGRPSAERWGTALALDVPRKEALPFSVGAPNPSWPNPTSHAGPGEATPLAADTPPELTLEQHASMTVDIDVAPELAMSVLTRYHLTVETKRAMDVYYRALMAADPAVRDAWHRACQACRARR